jgi:xanthosine utilization system XapX-like protein
MKRRVYRSGYERKRDQRIGAVAFPLVNAVVWLAILWMPGWIGTMLPAGVPPVQLQTFFRLLPWVVNGGVLIWAFIFRPQIGVGYITCFGAILFAGVALAVVAVGSCAISIPFIALIGLPGLLVFVAAALIGFAWLVSVGYEKVNWWWSNYEDAPEGPPSQQ